MSKEFYLKQFSPDGGMYSDIRVLRPSQHYDPVPSGHDDLSIDQILHVIEYSAYNQKVYELDKSRQDHCKRIDELRAEIERLIRLTT